MNPPVIDRREQNELAAGLRDLISANAPEWPTAAAVAGDPAAETFVQVFARLLKIIIDRLNRVPDKNFLEFLGMLGYDLAPPRAASAPLRFKVQPNVEAGGQVPAGTQIAVEGARSDVIFETRESLEITLPEIARLFSYEPDLDRYTDHASVLDEGDTASASLFEGSTQVSHRIYFGHDTLFDFPAGARVQFDLTFKYEIDYDPGTWNVRWYQLDEEGQAVELPALDNTTASSQMRGDGTVELPTAGSADPVASLALSGFSRKTASEREWPTFAAERRWIYAELDSPLPVENYARASGIAPERMLSSDLPVSTQSAFLPFREEPVSSGDVFLIASGEVFGRAGSTITMDVTIQLPFPFPDAVSIAYEYWSGTDWTPFAETSKDGVIDAGAYGFIDTTNAFTQTGIVRFFMPPSVAKNEDSLVTHWLRLRITGGGYGDGPQLDPPLIEAIELEHSNIPELATAKARVLIDSPGDGKLDAAFLGQNEIDLSRDFYPFGERPRFNDTFYFASEEVFTRTGGTITIDIEVSPGLPLSPQGSSDLQLLWEYYDGSDWLKLGSVIYNGAVDPAGFGFDDTTNAFTASGTVSFTLPQTAQWNIRATDRSFLRVRIIDGDYGDDPDYRPPALQKFTLGYTFSEESALEQIVLENNFFYKDVTTTVNGNEGASAITYVQPMQAPTDREASVLIGFDRSIAGEPLSLLFPLITRPFNAFLNSFNPDPPQIAWEYWNGTQWAGVSVDDRSDNLTRKEIVTILAPGNTLGRPLFGDDRFWLRLRLERGGYTLKPEIETLYTNVVWSDNQATISDEVLGSSNAQPSQSFKTARAPLLAGPRIVVLEQALTEEDRAIVIADEGEDAIQEILNDGGDVIETRVRWHQVSQFDLSSPRSRHYTLDHATGEIVFGDGTFGYIPPAGSNNVLAEEYRVGGGVAGNVQSGISDQRSSFAFVESVDNPVPAEGGVDQETVDGIRRRGPAAIKHRNRAVTHEDFNAVVLEASGQIARVRTLQATDSTFNFRPGHVTVIIVPESTDAKPFPSPELVESVTSYLETRASSFLLDALAPQISVVGPGFVSVGVEADVVYRDIRQAKEVERNIRARLDEFLHPLTGGPDGTGWTFGRNVYISEIYSVIENVAGVDYVATAAMRGSEQIYDLDLVQPFTPQVPFPVASTLVVNGSRATDAGDRNVEMIYGLVTKLREDVPVEMLTAVAFKEGDFATLTGPNDENPLSLLIRTLSGALLEIDPAFAPVAYPAGSKLVIFDENGNVRTKTTLVEGVPAETEVTALETAVPVAGDAYSLTSIQSTTNVRTGVLAGVNDQVSVIALDQNFLVYPGSHLIRTAQTG